ncbi:MAG TPA: hypothetical protein VF905_10890 [Nitrospirota bacterium]
MMGASLDEARDMAPNTENKKWAEYIADCKATDHLDHASTCTYTSLGKTGFYSVYGPGRERFRCDVCGLEEVK